MAQRVLITGGAGFIGSHLADRLVEGGAEVHILDDLSTGTILNIEHLKGRPGFGYTIDSVINEPLLAELVDRSDVIYHLAAAVGVKLIVDEPVKTMETNIKGTELVLQCAAKKGKKVLVASTSEVYGKSEDVPFQEDQDLVIGPPSRARWSYACSKAIDEFLALSYTQSGKLPTVVVRLFNTVGPRQTGRYGMVIPNFVQAALEGRPLTVFGNGKQSRCFGDVGDVVRALEALMACDAAVGEVVNIGNDTEISIEDLAAKVISRCQSPSEIVYVPYDQAYAKGFEDTMRRMPDLNKLESLIGFRPSLDIEAILDRVIEHERARGNGSGPSTCADPPTQTNPSGETTS